MQTPYLATRHVRCPIEDRALVLFHPDDLTHRRDAAPRWWSVREEVLPEMAAGRLTLIVTGAGEYTDVEVAGALPADRAVPRKTFRFPLHVRHGKVFLGPVSTLPSRDQPEGDTEEWGAWIDLLPGHYAVDVELLETGAYRIGVMPAADPPAPPERVPDLSLSHEQWDGYVTRPRHLETLLDAALEAHTPHQQRFLRRVSAHDRYDVDQETGLILLSSQDEPILKAPFQAIGTYGFLSSTWRWAWANESIDTPLCLLVERVREEGKRRGIDWLVEPVLPVGLHDMERLVALAARIMGLSGWYAASYDDGMLLVAVDERGRPEVATAEA